MNSKKNFIKIDERSKLIGLKVIAIMYFLTIFGIKISVLYRQFILNQSHGDFEDLSIILTVNVLFLISALLYFGAIPIQRLSIKTVLYGYLLIVVLGTIFTYVKYNVIQEVGLTVGQMIDKLIIIFSISGLMVIFFMIFSYLGKRKIEKELE